jgi:hypothetical protein
MFRGDHGRDRVCPYENVMAAFPLATDADRERARQDPEFRAQLLSESLDGLLSELNTLRAAASTPLRARQIKEGVDLAVKLASLLQK